MKQIIIIPVNTMEKEVFLIRARQMVGTYFDRLRSFRPNANLYLLSAVITGASMGVFRLLFNF